jgi:hypothetical protein
VAAVAAFTIPNLVPISVGAITAIQLAFILAWQQQGTAKSLLTAARLFESSSVHSQ